MLPINVIRIEDNRDGTITITADNTTYSNNTTCFFKNFEVTRNGKKRVFGSNPLTLDLDVDTDITAVYSSGAI